MSETSAAFFIRSILPNIPKKIAEKLQKIRASMMDGVIRCYNDWSELVTMILSIISLEIARYARKKEARLLSNLLI